MKLSLCMIAKDEAPCIGTALQSVKGFVDEIIVIDTGSTDETPLIAKSFGAVVHTSPWQKDFSYHRNESLALATGDWILILDCDEVLAPTHLPELKSQIAHAPQSCMAYNVSTTNVIDSIPLVTFESVRLFRNHHHFQFEGPIHEQIIPSIQQQYGLDAISPLPLSILHHGYAPEIMTSKNKVARNLEILKKTPQKTGYIYAMIGDEYYKSQSFSLAIKYYRKSLRLDSSLRGYYAILLIINYTTSLISLNDYATALDFIQKAQKVYPHFLDLYFLTFWIHDQCSEYALALHSLDQYLSMQNQPCILVVKHYEMIYPLASFRLTLLAKLQQS